VPHVPAQGWHAGVRTRRNERAREAVYTVDMAYDGIINVLELRLVDDDEGAFRVDGFVDGKRLPRRDDDEMDVPYGLLPSIEAAGDFFMVTCECGDPGCSGYMDPVVVTHNGDIVRWCSEDLGWDFTFEREPYAREIRRLVDEGRRELRERSIRLGRVGQYHQNLRLFASESFERSLPPVWEREAKSRVEERLRRHLWENAPEEFRRRFRRSPLWVPVRIAMVILLLPLLIPIWIVMYVWYFAARELDRREGRFGKR